MVSLQNFKLLLPRYENEYIEDSDRGSNGIAVFTKYNNLIDNLELILNSSNPNSWGSLPTQNKEGLFSNLSLGENNNCLIVDKETNLGLRYEERVDLKSDQNIRGKKTFYDTTEFLSNIEVDKDSSFNSDLIVNKTLNANTFILNNNSTIKGSQLISGSLTVKGLTLVESTLQLKNDLVNHGSSYFNGNIEVNGITNFNELVNFKSKLNLSSDLNVLGNINSNNNLSIGGSLQVDKSALINSNLEVKGNLTLGTTLNVESSTYIKGDLETESKATFNSLEVNSNTLLNSNVNITENLTVNGNLSIANKSQFTNEVIFGSNLDVKGNLTIKDINAINLYLTSKLRVESDTNLLRLEVRDKANFLNSVVISNDLSCTNLKVLSDLNIDRDCEINGNLVLVKTLNLSGDLISNKSAKFSDLTLLNSLKVKNIITDTTIESLDILTKSLSTEELNTNTLNTYKLNVKELIVEDLTKLNDLKVNEVECLATINTSRLICSNDISCNGRIIAVNLSGVNTGDEEIATEEKAGIVKVKGDNKELVLSKDYIETNFLNKNLLGVYRGIATLDEEGFLSEEYIREERLKLKYVETLSTSKIPSSSLEVLLNHNLNSYDVIVQIWSSNNNLIMNGYSIELIDGNNIKLKVNDKSTFINSRVIILS